MPLSRNRSLFLSFVVLFSKKVNTLLELFKEGKGEEGIPSLCVEPTR